MNHRPRHSATKRYTPRHAGSVRHRSRVGIWLALAGLWVVALAGVGAYLTVGNGSGDRGAAARRGDEPGAADTASTDIPTVERPRYPVNAPGVAPLAPSPPVSLQIPAIGVQSGLQPLALGEDGELQAPTDFGTAGWFAAGTEPGQPGPAVIAGHVDSTAGPAVFYSLDLLVVGDEVLVGRQDGQVVRFLVTDVQRHPKDAFPTAAVYGPVPSAELRLITCDGPFDRSAHSYQDNLVVFATAADRPTWTP